MHQQGKTDDQIGVEFERTKSVVLNAMIDDLLLEQVNSEGCGPDAGISLTRTCLE